MRDEEGHEYDDDGNIISDPDHDGGIRTAVRVFSENPAAAKARYGPIASWDVSEVTTLSVLFINQAGFNEDLSRWNVSNVVNMNGTFNGATSFNGDLSCWDVSNVEHMNCMFNGATSFDRQLSRAWATSTANKDGMFSRSPGTISGRRKDAHGTIE